MKVKAFIISGLLAVFSIIRVWASNLDLDDQTTKANLIKLASAQILEKNINEALGTSHFLEKTQLHTELGGAIKSLDEIDLAVDSTICDYIDIIKNNNGSPRMVDAIKKYMCNRRLSLKKSILKSAKST